VATRPPDGIEVIETVDNRSVVNAYEAWSVGRGGHSKTRSTSQILPRRYLTSSWMYGTSHDGIPKCSEGGWSPRACRSGYEVWVTIGRGVGQALIEGREDRPSPLVDGSKPVTGSALYLAGAGSCKRSRSPHSSPVYG
jgi:hypothetical protein